MTYSRIVLEAIMAMKRPLVTISPTNRVLEQDSRSPRLDFRGDDASLYVLWKITLSLIKLGLRETYRRRGDGRWWPGSLGALQARPRGPVPGGRLVAPLAPLRVSFGVGLRSG